MRAREPNLLDLVAVLNVPGDIPVEVGDVGTVVELLPPDAVEVEFLHRDGRTRCTATLAAVDVLVLNRERTPVSWIRLRHSQCLGIVMATPIAFVAGSLPFSASRWDRGAR